MYWIAFGDIHESTNLLGSIPGLAEAEGVIISGDITNVGDRDAVGSVIDAVTAINPNVLAQPGNMDTETVQTYLRERDMDIHLRARELAPGLGLMGVGLSTPTPFNTPGEVPEATLVKWLEETHALAAGYDKLICAVHEPPHGSSLDRLGNGQHVGSAGVRDFIERVQPDVVVVGHIHESMGAETIGNSLVVNPGMLAGGGYVRIDFTDGKLTAELKSV